MRTARVALAAGTGALAAVVGWGLFVALPRWYAAAPADARSVSGEATESAADRRIRAQLFYVAEDGWRLVRVEREVPYAETLADQARRLVEAQLAPPPAPLASALPAGTRLRNLFVDDRGTVYVDLSPEATAAHPGGSLDEILAVYTLVNAVTVNLPAARSVQILVDGREVDTLAGHVDLRHPLHTNLKWVESAGAGAPSAATGSPGG